MHTQVPVPSEFWLGIIVTIAFFVAIAAGIAFVVKFLIEASPDVLFVLFLLALFAIVAICGGLGILAFPSLS